MADEIDKAGIAALPKISIADIEETDLFFCSGNDYCSRWIQDATDSPISHVGMLSYDVRAGAWQVIEAFPPRVRDVPLAWYLNNYDGTGKPYDGDIIVGRWAGLTPEKAAGAVRFMLSKLGIGYGDWTLADIAFRIVDRKLPPIRNTGETYICSQAIQCAMDAEGCVIPMDANGFCDPGDVLSAKPVQIVGALLINR